MGPVRRVCTYGGVGMVILPINLGTAWLLTVFGTHYLVATLAGYAVHVTLAFVVNTAWTFASTSVHRPSALLRTYLVHTGSFFLVMGVTTVAVEVTALEFVYARIVASVCAGVWDYVLDTKVTFRKKLFS